MDIKIDTILARLRDVVEADITRNFGRPIDVNSSAFASIRSVEGPKNANEYLASNLWNDVLTEIKNSIYSRSRDHRNMVRADKIIGKSRDKILSILPPDFTFPELDNTPVGFTVSYPRQTVDYIFLLYTKEALLCSADDLPAPCHMEALLSILERGHLPCGWEGNLPSGTLLVY